MELGKKEEVLLKIAFNSDYWETPQDMLDEINGIIDGELMGSGEKNKPLVTTEVKGNQIILDVGTNQDLIPFVLHLFRTYGFVPVQKSDGDKDYILFDIPEKLRYEEKHNENYSADGVMSKEQYDNFTFQIASDIMGDFQSESSEYQSVLVNDIVKSLIDFPDEEIKSVIDFLKSEGATDTQNRFVSDIFSNMRD